MNTHIRALTASGARLALIAVCGAAIVTNPALADAPKSRPPQPSQHKFVPTKLKGMPISLFGLIGGNFQIETGAHPPKPPAGPRQSR